MFGLCATALVTDIIQLATGYHAPFFLTVCKPNYTLLGTPCDANPYITQDICSGTDKHAILSARYVPGGALCCCANPPAPSKPSLLSPPQEDFPVPACDALSFRCRLRIGEFPAPPSSLPCVCQRQGSVSSVPLGTCRWHTPTQQHGFHLGCGHLQLWALCTPCGQRLGKGEAVPLGSAGSAGARSCG